MDARCIIYYQFGCPEEVLRVARKRIETPKDNEVLVRMLARPINPSDLIPIRGAYSHRIALPGIPGYEGVGIVEEAGSLVPRQLIGKRVLPLRGEGTWQEYVKTSSEFAVPIPDSIDDYTASQMYINPLTAWVICTEVLKLKPHEVVLVNACGSSIGRILAQLSKVIGFRLIAVTRNNKHTQDLLQLGASHVIDTSQASLYETVMELTDGNGADAAIDSVGGISGNVLALCVRPRGYFLSIGLMSGEQVDWKEIASKAQIHANIFHLRYWNGHVSPDKWRETFHHVIRLVDDKRLHLMMPDSKYDLTDVRKAVGVVESSKLTNGKVLLTSHGVTTY